MTVSLSCTHPGDNVPLAYCLSTSERLTKANSLQVYNIVLHIQNDPSRSGPNSEQPILKTTHHTTTQSPKVPQQRKTHREMTQVISRSRLKGTNTGPQLAVLVLSSTEGDGISIVISSCWHQKR